MFEKFKNKSNDGISKSEIRLAGINKVIPLIEELKDNPDRSFILMVEDGEGHLVSHSYGRPSERVTAIVSLIEDIKEDVPEADICFLFQNNNFESFTFVRWNP